MEPLQTRMEYKKNYWTLFPDGRIFGKITQKGPKKMSMPGQKLKAVKLGKGRRKPWN
jgi:hypothetical protein